MREGGSARIQRGAFIYSQDPEVPYVKGDYGPGLAEHTKKTSHQNGSPKVGNVFHRQLRFSMAENILHFMSNSLNEMQT